MILKNLFTGQQWRKKCREQTYGHGEKVRCMERVTWKLTLPYVEQIGNWNFLNGSGNSNLEAWDGEGDEMRGRFKREGMYVYLWLIHVEV